LSIKFATRISACGMLMTFCLLSAAQQTPPPSTDPMAQSPAQASPEKPQETPKSSAPEPGQSKPGETVPGSSSTQGKVSGTSNDRLFYALPNFLSLENAGNVPALTAKQKFAVVARGSFDYAQIPWYGFLAGISQAEDSEPGFGQGAAGYGKRFGSSLADGTIENFMTGAILPSLLHEDPRFFQSGKGGFTRRSAYAVSRTFVTRTDSGGEQFNYSELVGSAMSAAISTYSYHPTSKFIATKSGVRFVQSDRTLANTASVWGSQVGYDTLTIVVKEFWPDIHRKLSRKSSKNAHGTNP
jgi:hypothetical protein